MGSTLSLLRLVRPVPLIVYQFVCEEVCKAREWIPIPVTQAKRQRRSGSVDIAFDLAIFEDVWSEEDVHAGESHDPN